MATIDSHPSAEELSAFTLGQLDDVRFTVVEGHLLDCSRCQEQAAAAPDDRLVEMLRVVHAREHQGETVTTAESHIEVDIPEEFPDVLANHVRYRVIRLVGKGGMGEVYEAEHRFMQRPVAVKVIKRAFTANTAAVERFQREVRAAAKLSHPNIVHAYDAENSGETHFLVMEYIAGIPLSRLVAERGPLPLAEACDYIRQAAMGLQHAHERGMVHRDIKPENLILADDGRVKVLDFGLAALTLERGQGLTEENVVMGTPDYMAPEQAEDARSADTRSDVYSLGCTLFRLLTGKVPYPATTSMRKILAHRENPVPSVRDARPEVPAELAAVVARMMAKKPDDRYRTPGEVAAALVPFATAKQGEKKPPRGLRWLIAAAVMLAASAGMAGVVVHRIQTDTGNLVITTDNDDVEVVVKKGGKIVRIIDTRTDKSITLYSGVYELELKGAKGLKLDIDKATLMRGKTVLAKIERVQKPGMQEPTASDIEVLQRAAVPRGDQVIQAAVAPDGKRFAAALGESGFTIVWDGQTGKELYRTSGNGWGCAFTPDGRRLLTTDDHKVYIHDAASGKVERAVTMRPKVTAVAALPDRRRGLFMTGDKKLHLLDLESGKILQSWPVRDFHFASTNDGKVLFVKAAGKAAHVVWDVRNNRAFDGYAQLARYERICHFLPGDKQAWVFDGKEQYLASADGRRKSKISDLPGRYIAASRCAIYRGVELLGYPGGKLRLLVGPTWKERASFDLANGDRFIKDHTISLSPDARFACVATERSVYLLRLPALRQSEAVKPVEVFRKKWPGWVNWGVDLSPDGSRLIVMHWGGARVCDVASGKVLHVVDAGRAHFTPSGKHFVALSGPNPSGSLRVYDSVSGKLVRQFFKHPEEKVPVGIILCPDGRTVRVEIRGQGQYWDFMTGKPLPEKDSNPWTSTTFWGSKEVAAFAGSQKKTLPSFVVEAVLPGDREVMARYPLNGRAFGIYDVHTGRLVRTIALSGGDRIDEHYKSTCYGRDRCPRIAVYRPNGFIHVLDLVTGKELCRFSEVFFQPKCLAMSADGRYLAACASNQQSDVVVWRLPDPPKARD